MARHSPLVQLLVAPIALTLPMLIGLAEPARAAVPVLPGQSVDLGGSDVGGGADGGDVTCTLGVVDVTCGFPTGLGFAGTTTEPADNFVVARHGAILGTGLGEPHLASARIYDDFTIPGPAESFVSVQISVSYDLFVSLLGSAAYEVAGELGLVVEDVTTGTAEGVGAASLFRQDRSGDQGFTDITTGREAYRIYHGRGNLQLLLRRGRTYRVWFQAEAMSEQFVVGKSETDTEATRRQMVVHVDEDEVDLLANHDRDVKQQLARIESKIDDVNEKLGLLLRTQLEQTLVTPREARLTVLHTDRMEEVCNAAQQAIDASDARGYRVKQSAQRLVDRAVGMMGSDPKQAVALCRNAYQSAAFPRKLE